MQNGALVVAGVLNLVKAVCKQAKRSHDIVETSQSFDCCRGVAAETRRVAVDSRTKEDGVVVDSVAYL